jgi:hypothetical protein
MFIRWQKTPHNPGNHRTASVSLIRAPLRGIGACTPCTDCRGSSFHLWPTIPTSSNTCGWSLPKEEILASVPSPPYHTSLCALATGSNSIGHGGERTEAHCQWHTASFSSTYHLVPCRRTANAVILMTPRAGVLHERRTHQLRPYSSHLHLNFHNFSLLAKLGTMLAWAKKQRAISMQWKVLLYYQGRA